MWEIEDVREAERIAVKGPKHNWVGELVRFRDQEGKVRW